jgi:hypothetical protein
MSFCPALEPFADGLPVACNSCWTGTLAYGNLRDVASLNSKTADGRRPKLTEAINFVGVCQRPSAVLISFIFGTDLQKIVADLLSIDSILFGKVDHGLEIFRLGIVDRASRGHDESAIFGANVNHLPAKLFYFFGGSGSEQ